jgi:ribonuclease HIII
MKRVDPLCSLAVSEETMAKMLDFYKPFSKPVNNEYVALFATYEGGVVNLYKKNKDGQYKAVFQGIGAVKEAQIWDPEAKNTAHQPELPRPFSPFHPGPVVINRYPQIGSDEVGTGDFFGPVCVCAAYVEVKDLDRLKELKITDSKQMDDSYILSIGPTLIHEFEYSQVSLQNEKFNDIHDEYNMNAIKAKMHNRCLLNLKKKHPEAKVYQDQFAEAPLYFSYLKDEKEIVSDIFFKTKGELAFPSVALASVIARYSFLRKMQEMSKEYGMQFPFGAGEDVDRFAVEFVKKHGKEKLREVAKLNWANYKKIS